MSEQLSNNDTFSKKNWTPRTTVSSVSLPKFEITIDKSFINKQ